MLNIITGFWESKDAAVLCRNVSHTRTSLNKDVPHLPVNSHESHHCGKHSFSEMVCLHYSYRLKSPTRTSKWASILRWLRCKFGIERQSSYVCDISPLLTILHGGLLLSLSVVLIDSDAVPQKSACQASNNQLSNEFPGSKDKVTIPCLLWTQRKWKPFLHMNSQTQTFIFTVHRSWQA